MRESNKNKLLDLLSKFELQDRLVIDTTKLETILNNYLDVDRFERTIISEQKRTVEYLKKNIC